MYIRECQKDNIGPEFFFQSGPDFFKWEGATGRNKKEISTKGQLISKANSLVLI